MEKRASIPKLELARLKQRIELEPDHIVSLAENYLLPATAANNVHDIQQLQIILSRCAAAKGDYPSGLKLIKQAHQIQNELDNDDSLAEIFHVYALHFSGQGKHYTAQQYWINALEQASWSDEQDILIESLIGLGTIWRIHHHYHLACSTHELAVNVANKHRSAALEGKARILWAWDLYLLNQHLDMLSVLDGAEQALDSDVEQIWQAQIWEFRSLALLGLERLTDAEQAAQRAHQLADQHNLPRMKAHAYLCRARLELIRDELNSAMQLLYLAEQSAQQFADHGLLAQIYSQQATVAEQANDYSNALIAFRNYRRLCHTMSRQQAQQKATDKARTSKFQLEQRAIKLIHRVRSQYEYDPNKHLSHVVSENDWWEQLMLCKAELSYSGHCVVIIYHENPVYLEACTASIHALCVHPDRLSRLSPNHLGLLLAETGIKAKQMSQSIVNVLDAFPWQRKGLEEQPPTLTQYDILRFPFTLEQLEQVAAQDQ